jgi:hypothetical protein
VSELNGPRKNNQGGGVDQVDYRPVNACLRPPRVAIIYRAGNHWIHHARQVITSMSRIWGGAGAVMLPMGADERLSPTLLGLLRVYDPDLIWVRLLWRGVELVPPRTL